MIKWSQACETGMIQQENGCLKWRFKKLCKSGTQNATVCKVFSHSTVEVGKVYYSARLHFENTIYKLSYNDRS